MRYHEFKALKPYKAQVKLEHDKSLLTTITWAKSSLSALRNLIFLYGAANVDSVCEITLTEEKLISAQDQQIKSMQDRAKHLKQQAKLAKARQSVTKAQQQLRQATAPSALVSKS